MLKKKKNMEKIRGLDFEKIMIILKILLEKHKEEKFLIKIRVFLTRNKKKNFILFELSKLFSKQHFQYEKAEKKNNTQNLTGKNTSTYIQIYFSKKKGHFYIDIIHNLFFFQIKILEATIVPKSPFKINENQREKIFLTFDESFIKFSHLRLFKFILTEIYEQINPDSFQNILFNKIVSFFYIGGRVFIRVFYKEDSYKTQLNMKNGKKSENISEIGPRVILKIEKISHRSQKKSPLIFSA